MDGIKYVVMVRQKGGWYEAAKTFSSIIEALDFNTKVHHNGLTDCSTIIVEVVDGVVVTAYM